MLWYKNLESKKLLIPKIDKGGTVSFVSIFVYSSFMMFIGMVLGLYLNIIFYIIPHLIIFSILDDNLSFNRGQFELAYTQLHFPEFLIIAYFFGFCVSLVIIAISYCDTKDLNENIIKLLTDTHKHDFPYIKIRTETGEIKGQLRGILDGLVTCSENNTLKTVKWDKIETMEVTPKDKKEPYIF